MGNWTSNTKSPVVEKDIGPKYRRGWYVDRDNFEELYLEHDSSPGYACSKRIIRKRFPGENTETLSYQGFNWSWCFSHAYPVEPGTFETLKTKTMVEKTFIDMTRCVRMGIMNPDDCQADIKVDK